MKLFFQFILSHSIFIAFCASALSFQTWQLLLLPTDQYLLAFVFFAVLGAYNTYWILCGYSHNLPNSFWSFFQKRISSFLVLLIAIIGAFFCFARIHLVIYNLIIAAVLMGVYSVPVFPFNLPPLVRKAGIFKTFILAISWTIITTLVSMKTSILEMGQTAIMVFINRFLFMLMLCIIFDKRDTVVDKMRGLQSLATEMKPRVLHYLFGFVFISYTLVSYLLGEYQVAISQVVALILSGVVTLFVYIASLQKRGYLFYYFVVDGLMFLSGLLTWVARGW